MRKFIPEDQGFPSSYYGAAELLRSLRGLTPDMGSGSFWILAGAIWSAPPRAALWLSAEPVARADVPFQLSVAKRAKAAALPPHSKSPTVSGPSYRTPQNEPLPNSGFD